MKRPDGVLVIALWFLLVGVLCGLGALTLLVIPVPAVLFTSSGIDRLWAMWGLGIAVVFTSTPAVLSLATGIGLLALKEWGRWLAIALALFMLLAIPFGTLAGILIIWYLLQENVKVAFDNPTTAIAKP